jgi:hypothetical protein
MALIDKASLLMVPSTYEAGKLYNVLPSGNRAPDSTGENSGYDQTRADFDFDRGSNAAATRVNADGLIEKYRENLCLYSNTFNNASWAVPNATITSGQIGYDNSSDAWLLNSAGIGGNLNRGQTDIGVLTFSIYAKKGTTDGIRIRFDQTTDSNIYIDLNDGSDAYTALNVISHSTTSIGGGWYRISMTFMSSGLTLFRIYPTDDAGNSVAGSIYIQNAQLESGLVATDYLESTSVTGKAGVLIDLPRIDYSSGAGALLLEPSRQQLYQFSEYYEASDWSNSALTIETNKDISPEGVKNASKIYPSASGSISYLYSIKSGVAATYTLSAYVKAAGKNVVWLYINSGSANGTIYFDLSDQSKQVVAGSAQTPTGDIESLGNDWYRITFTTGGGITLNSGSGIGVSDAKGSTSVTKSGEDGVLVYGLQLEAASYPTSYIPNHGESGGVTRAADSCSVTGVSDVIGQTEGTMFVDVDAETIGKMGSNGTQRIIMVSDGTNTNRTIINFFQNSSGVTQVEANLIKGTSQASFANTISENKKYKLAFAYKANDFTFYVNGVQIGTDTSGSTYSSGTLTRLDLGQDRTSTLQQANPIKQAILFNERLTNEELATLTTL